MELEFLEDLLGKQLKALSRWKQSAFLISCCEVMYPNYVLFSMDTNWGKPRLLRRCIDAGWSWIAGSEPPKSPEWLYRQSERQMPDIEEFDSIYAPAAVDASQGCMNLASLMVKFNSKKPIETASVSYESVLTYAQQLATINPESPADEKRVRRHALVQKELLRQKKAIAELQTLSDDQTKGIQLLRSMWAGLNVGSLGIPMNPPEAMGYDITKEELERFITNLWIRSYRDRKRIRDFFEQELNVRIDLRRSGLLFSDTTGEISPIEFHRRTQDDSLVRLDIYRWMHSLSR